MGILSTLASAYSLGTLPALFYVGKGIPLKISYVISLEASQPIALKISQKVPLENLNWIERIAISKSISKESLKCNCPIASQRETPRNFKKKKLT